LKDKLQQQQRQQQQQQQQMDGYISMGNNCAIGSTHILKTKKIIARTNYQIATANLCVCRLNFESNALTFVSK
jgi:hypothetical protein